MPIHRNLNVGTFTNHRHCPCLLCLALGAEGDLHNCEHEIVWAYHFGQAIRIEGRD